MDCVFLEEVRQVLTEAKLTQSLSQYKVRQVQTWQVGLQDRRTVQSFWSWYSRGLADSSSSYLTVL